MRKPRVKSQGQSPTERPPLPQSPQTPPRCPASPRAGSHGPLPLQWVLPCRPPTPPPQDIDGLLQVLEVPLDAAQAIPQLIGRPVQLLASDRRALMQKLAPPLVKPAGRVHRLLHLAAGRGTAGAAGGRRSSLPPLRPQTSWGLRRPSYPTAYPSHTATGRSRRRCPECLTCSVWHAGTGWQGDSTPSVLPHRCHSPSDYKKRIFERHVTPLTRPKASPLPSRPGKLVPSKRCKTSRHPRPRHVTTAIIESWAARREREALAARSAETSALSFAILVVGRDGFLSARTAPSRPGPRRCPSSVWLGSTQSSKSLGSRPNLSDCCCATCFPSGQCK